MLSMYRGRKETNGSQNIEGQTVCFKVLFCRCLSKQSTKRAITCVFTKCSSVCVCVCMYVCVCVRKLLKGEEGKVSSLNEVIGMVGIGFKSLGFLLHAFLDFQDGRRLRLILQTMNKPEWLKNKISKWVPLSFSFPFRFK